ncbi:MAG TPA: cytochrome c3 family protein [Candidatus Acidoferrum sp.]|nr:cytochrome c3 family protein [Candidatus Acidoferrum sp.]
MNPQKRTTLTLTGLTLAFLALTALFLSNRPGRPVRLPPIPLVGTDFLDTATVRRSYADLARAQEDLSDFECYTCHEKGKPPPLRYDLNQNLIVPKEHSDIVMGHGSHGRNNNCFNCHNETNLEQLQTRDGRALTFSDSPMLCGSCHGPTYRDWEAGAHGRISGYWDQALGPAQRKQCVNCHNPHSPHFPPRQPAPGPHPLRAVAVAAVESEPNH